MGKYGSPEIVEFKKEHIILLQNANWVLGNIEHGHWCIDESIPYISNNPEKDICDLTKCKKEEAEDLHGSLLWVLDIIKDCIKYNVCKDYINIEHFKLIKNLHFSNYSTHNVNFGQISIDQKRPYGNSNVYSDIAFILGIPDSELFCNDRVFNIKEKWLDYFSNLEKTLIESLKLIFLKYKFKYGSYINPESYYDPWILDKHKRRVDLIKNINENKNGK